MRGRKVKSHRDAIESRMNGMQSKNSSRQSAVLELIIELHRRMAFWFESENRSNQTAEVNDTNRTLIT